MTYVPWFYSTYPPRTRIIAFSGLEKVIIKLTCGGARLLPIITMAANGIQVYSALPYPFHIKIVSVTNDNSKIIALSIILFINIKRFTSLIFQCWILIIYGEIRIHSSTRNI
jgi:hypothetical protein